jgi:membrane protein YdbS with pleckstrin-like domain
MTVNPYQSGNEVVRAELTDASQDVVRLERSMAWLWASVVFLWAIVILFALVAVGNWISVAQPVLDQAGNSR